MCTCCQILLQLPGFLSRGGAKPVLFFGPDELTLWLREAIMFSSFDKLTLSTSSVGTSLKIVTLFTSVNLGQAKNKFPMSTNCIPLHPDKFVEEYHLFHFLRSNIYYPGIHDILIFVWKHQQENNLRLIRLIAFYKPTLSFT